MFTWTLSCKRVFNLTPLFTDYKILLWMWWLFKILNNCYSFTKTFFLNQIKTQQYVVKVKKLSQHLKVNGKSSKFMFTIENVFASVSYPSSVPAVAWQTWWRVPRSLAAWVHPGAHGPATPGGWSGTCAPNPHLVPGNHSHLQQAWTAGLEMWRKYSIFEVISNKNFKMFKFCMLNHFCTNCTS